MVYIVGLILVLIGGGMVGWYGNWKVILGYTLAMLGMALVGMALA